jgi:hypothetical protein
MKKWKEFLDLNIALTPHEMKYELQSIQGIQITNELYDSVTNEIHLDFSFNKYKFSLHNPYGGVYGYWFFFKIRNNNSEVTNELVELLQNHFKNK